MDNPIVVGVLSGLVGALVGAIVGFWLGRADERAHNKETARNILFEIQDALKALISKQKTFRDTDEQVQGFEASERRLATLLADLDLTVWARLDQDAATQTARLVASLKDLITSSLSKGERPGSTLAQLAALDNETELEEHIGTTMRTYKQGVPYSECLCKVRRIIARLDG
ncbi:MAG: hypothetical protein KAW89_06985 [Armatimonadetes bacterium]|nr:hypothetical protein [Armatimonadota bacterium]